jgi:hypothetical protein
MMMGNISLYGTMSRGKSNFHITWKMRDIKKGFYGMRKDIGLLAQKNMISFPDSFKQGRGNICAEEIIFNKSNVEPSSGSTHKNEDSVSLINTHTLKFHHFYDYYNDDATLGCDINQSLLFSNDQIGIEKHFNDSYVPSFTSIKLLKCFEPLSAIKMVVMASKIKAIHFLLRPYAYQIWAQEGMPRVNLLGAYGPYAQEHKINFQILSDEQK